MTRARMTRDHEKPPLDEIGRQWLMRLPPGVDKITAQLLWRDVFYEMCLMFWPPFPVDGTDTGLAEKYITLLRAYADDLKEYSPAHVGDTWKKLRREARSTRWPAIAVFRAALDAAIFDSDDYPPWKKYLAEQMPRVSFNAFIAPLHLEEIDRVRGCVVVRAPSSVVAAHVRRHHETDLRIGIARMYPGVRYINIHVGAA